MIRNRLPIKCALVVALGMCAFGASAQGNRYVTVPTNFAINPVRWERVFTFRDRVVTNITVFDSIRCDGLSYGVSNRVWTAQVTALSNRRERELRPVRISQADLLDVAAEAGVSASVTTNYFDALHTLMVRRARARLVAEVTGRGQ